ncbi:MAG: hypothetical protein P4M11_16055 [Candidatus Pacebacteria bacterium]|nr:hypothetical protein [Candidatus Paceibacterota bacterium]
MRDVYTIGFPELKKAFYVHTRLIKDGFPKVFKHFVSSQPKSDRSKSALDRRCTAQAGS